MHIITSIGGVPAGQVRLRHIAAEAADRARNILERERRIRVARKSLANTAEIVLNAVKHWGPDEDAITDAVSACVVMRWTRAVRESAKKRTEQD